MFARCKHSRAGCHCVEAVHIQHEAGDVCRPSGLAEAVTVSVIMLVNQKNHLAHKLYASVPHVLSEVIDLPRTGNNFFGSGFQ